MQLMAGFSALSPSFFSCSESACVGTKFEVTTDVGGEDPYSVFVKVQDLDDFTSVDVEVGEDVDVPIIPFLENKVFDSKIWLVFAGSVLICLLCLVCGKIYLCLNHKHLELGHGPAQKLADHDHDEEANLKHDESGSEIEMDSDLSLSGSGSGSESEHKKHGHHHKKASNKRTKEKKKASKDASSESESGGSDGSESAGSESL